MVKISLPESVKIARVELPLDLALSGSPFPVNMGHDEIMVLLSLYCTWEMTATAGYDIVRFGLWRKSDTDPVAMRTDHTDMIWETSDVRLFVTESMAFSSREHIVFPHPLVLIRPPRLVGLRVQTAGAHVDMRLYHIIRKVSSDELAKLMVKDHA
ncbi:hypothetical protein ES703_90458 [subsurface metagenome]